MKRMVLSNDGLNRNGYRVLTAGIRIAAFLKNPVMLLGHDAAMLPIGKWDDLQFDDKGTLTAIPVFDETDPLGVAVKSKFEQGMLSAASIGFKTLTTSADPKDLLLGQKYETVTSCELLEVSMVCIPGNSDATTLSAHSDTPLKTLSIHNPSIKMDKIIQQLGLSPDSTQDQIVDAVKGLQTKVAEADKSRVESILSLGEANGHITDTNREAFRKLANADHESVRQLLSVIKTDRADNPEKGTPPPPPGTSLMGQLHAGKPSGAAPAPITLTFHEMRKQDPVGLLALKESDPAGYRKLAAASGVTV